MIVPAQQDLKEQDEASRIQPWSARGLVDPRMFLQPEIGPDADHIPS